MIRAAVFRPVLRLGFAACLSLAVPSTGGAQTFAGFRVGGGFGAFDVSCPSCTSAQRLADGGTDRATATAEFSLILNSHMLANGEFRVWLNSLPLERRQSVSELFCYCGSLSYYPLESGGPYIQGGAGLLLGTHVTHRQPQITSDLTGFSFMAGGGYDVPAGQMFGYELFVTPAVSFWRQDFDRWQAKAVTYNISLTFRR